MKTNERHGIKDRRDQRRLGASTSSIDLVSSLTAGVSTAGDADHSISTNLTAVINNLVVQPFPTNQGFPDNQQLKTNKGRSQECSWAQLSSAEEHNRTFEPSTFIFRPSETGGGGQALPVVFRFPRAPLPVSCVGCFSQVCVHTHSLGLLLPARQDLLQGSHRQRLLQHEGTDGQIRRNILEPQENTGWMAVSHTPWW